MLATGTLLGARPAGLQPDSAGGPARVQAAALRDTLAPARVTPRPSLHLPAARHGGRATPVRQRAAVLPGSSSYRFLTLLGGQPVRWNPCAAIHWRFSPAGAPAGGAAVVAAAVREVAGISGTTWVYDGPSAGTPSTTALPRSADQSRPVLIGWTTSARSDLLRGQPASVLGMTRTSWFGTDDHRGHQLAATRGAVVALNAADHLRLTGPASWRTVVLHELGHAMGLDHVNNPAELMNPTISPRLTDLQGGDRAGLVRLGRSAGCLALPAT